MAITYAAGTDLITVDTSTYTLDQINTAIADPAHWDKLGEMHYCKANLLITGSGKIIDENSGFQLGSAAARKTFETHVNTEFKLERCLIGFYTNARKTSYGLWEFKKSVVLASETDFAQLYMRGEQNHSDSVMTVDVWYNRDGICSYDNVKVFNSSTFCYYTTGTVNQLYVSGELLGYFVPSVIKNTTIAGQIRIGETGVYITAINTTWGNLSFGFANNYLIEKWEYNVLVTNDQGIPQQAATCTLRDETGAIKWSGTTGADGRSAVFEATVARYDGTAETKTSYNKFNLTVEKSGFTTYEADVTIDHLIQDDQVALDALTYTIDDIVTGINDMKGTGFVKDTDSLVNHSDDLTFLRDEAGGKWELVGDQMIFYKENGTELMRFDLFDENGLSTMINVFKRERV